MVRKQSLRFPTSLAVDDFIGDVGWDFGVVGEFHGVAGATLGHAAHLGSIAEHRGERNFRADLLDPSIALATDGLKYTG